MKQQATGADAFAPFQQALSEGWTKALESLQQSAVQGASAFNGGGTPLWQLPPGATLPELPKVSIAPEKLQSIQQQYMAEATELWRRGFDARPEGDRRFAGEAWGSNPLAAFSAAVYLLNGRTLLSMAEAIDADEKTKARMRFAVEQWMAAASPSNSLAFNAEAQKKAIDTQGESIAKGIQNLLHDVKQGHLSMTDESAFEVGATWPPPRAPWCSRTSISNCSNTNRSRPRSMSGRSCWCRRASTSSTSSTCSPRTP